jgi:hypothetical protein
MADLVATLTCPACGHASVETMPTAGCVAFYECPRCQAAIVPKPGDCCVFCSYGDRRCPFEQDGTVCPGPLPPPATAG